MTWLLDGNLLVLSGFDTHLYHERAHRSFRASSPDRFATCPLTQGTLLRVHMTLGFDGTAAAAWQALSEVVSHKRHVLWLDNFSSAGDTSSRPFTGTKTSNGRLAR